MIALLLSAEVVVCASPPTEFRQAVTAPPAAPACGVPIDVRSYYPPSARKWGIVGRVGLTCRSEDNGHVSHCEVTAQDPINQGFGAAALRMERLYRVDPEHGVGRREGGRVSFTVPFRLLPPGVEGPSDRLPPARPEGQIPQDALAAAYPPRARALGVEGQAIIQCVNAPPRELADCHVQSAGPAGFGFGEVALGLVARYLRAPDQSSRPGPFVVRPFRIAVTFRLPR